MVETHVLADPFRHSAGLVPAIRDLLEANGVGVDQLAGVVVGAGPGSFAGLKIAAATAKALAGRLRAPLFATSSLQAAAAAGARPQSADGREIRYALFDARGGRVYGACYDLGPDGSIQVKSPHGGTILDVLNDRPPRGAVFVGDGAVAHEKLIRAAGYVVQPPPAGVPGADGVLSCCDWAAVDAAAWQPDYVRAWKPG